MTTYFTAPDGIDEPTLWAREDEQLVSILRRCDLPYPHHWDELVARVIAGNPAPPLPPELTVDTREQDAELDRVLKRSLVLRDPYA